MLRLIVIIASLPPFFSCCHYRPSGGERTLAAHDIQLNAPVSLDVPPLPLPPV